MKKKKMTADNVEQLMEIVRSLQRGEDPEEAILKKEAERVPEADAPMAYLQGEENSPNSWEDTEEEAQEQPVKKRKPGGRIKRTGKKQPGLSQAEADEKIRSMREEQPEKDAEDWDEDDEFEQFLKEDSGEIFSGAVSKEAISGILGRVKEFFGKRQAEAEQRRLEKQKRRESEAAVRTEAGQEETPKPVGKDTDSSMSRSAGTARAERSGQKEELDVGRAERSLLKRRILARDEEDEELPSQALEDVHVFERITGLDNEPDESGEKAEEDNREQEESLRESPKPEEESGREADDGDQDLREEPFAPSTDGEAEEHPTEKKKKPAALRPNPWSGKIDLHSVKDYISDLLEELRQRGISRREWIMLGAGAVFAVLIIALVFNGITGAVSNKEKSKNVTADQGLTVLVEDEPKEWCGSYPVKLRIYASGAEIEKIQVNGSTYAADGDGIVTVEAESWLLEAEVETSQGTKKARIEIPWVDGDAPVVNAALNGEVISLTAADARSSVKKIYCAEVEQGALTTIPLYREYQEPISYRKGSLYYFYAEDAAGNRSVPVATTMAQAESLILRQESMALFPGETGELLARAEPSGALLTNLKYESMNPEILSVDSSGKVTAISEGTGTVKVSADKVDSVICTVEVSSSRTVTISALGDCTLGTDENFNTNTSFNAFQAVNGDAYFFANVKSILEADDATFANLEGTFTTSTAREAKEYAFKGDPSYTEILKEGSVDVVTLANNHSSDYGAQSLTDTQDALTEAGIDYCIGDTIVVKDVKGIRTGFIGIYVLNDGMARESQVRETIAAAKAQGAQLVIVAFHWGTERATEPDETQKSLAHIAIDSGADLVVGHHPHVLQGVEKYNGKYIAYSLGNFCFGGNSNPSDMTTMIFQQTFSVTGSGTAADGGVKVIPCSVSSTAGYNNYQPTPLSGDEAASVISRVNEYSASYGVTFSDSGTIEGM